MKNTDEFPKTNLYEKFDFSKIDWKALEKSLKNFSYEKEKYVWWPEIFDTKDLTGICDATLCADGLIAWGNCHAGFGIHPNFGEVMVMIGQRLGISPTGENLMEWSGNWLKKQKC
jgi:hypothetical protein